jgi:hypothetical protein
MKIKNQSRKNNFNRKNGWSLNPIKVKEYMHMLTIKENLSKGGRY